MKIITGNIFTSQCQTIVNTINCVGVMGAGIAYEFRLRYPDMYVKYLDLCEQGELKIGRLWIYKTQDKWVLNFPTKDHWKNETKPSYLEEGLTKFVNTYKEKNITSIAFPLLGAQNGGLSQEESLSIMERYLSQCDIDIEIYKYDPSAYDELFLKFKEYIDKYSDEVLYKSSGLRIDFFKKIREGIVDNDIKTISQLLSIKGIGQKTLEKLFKFTSADSNTIQQHQQQQSLDI